MYAAVHSERSGRVFVSADYAAAAFDGAATVPLATALPLPAGARLIPVPRDAQGFDRGGRARSLGRSRWALAAVLPAGLTRTHYPAHHDDAEEPLPPLAYAAVAADERGDLVAAAVATGPAQTARDDTDVEALVRAALRSRPSSRLLRQLARCAREYGCSAARDALAARRTAAAPVAATGNESPPPFIAPRVVTDAAPTEGAAFRPAAAEIAELATAHLAGGEGISFGRACEGEPLTAVRLLEEAIRQIRSATSSGSLHLETNGSHPAALRRLIAAGLDSVTVRLASARPETYQSLHGPLGYRWPDVRASLQLAAELARRIEVALLVLPGLTDRPSETEALADLLRALPRATVRLRDLAADPRRALALVRGAERPIGVAEALRRLAREAPHAGLVVGAASG